MAAGCVVPQPDRSTPPFSTASAMTLANTLSNVGVVVLTTLLGASSLSAQDPGTGTRPLYPPTGVPFFTDATASMELSFKHTDVVDTMAGGVCLFDYDDDGYTDVFATARGGTQNHLYHNQGNGKFVKSTFGSGLALASSSMGAYAADLDNNGTQDLLVIMSGAVRVYRNDGGGKFTNVSTTSAVRNTHWAASATFADYNNDGLLDIYIGNYVEQGFFPYFDGAPNKLFRNDGNMQFTDVSVAAGVEGYQTFWDERGFYRSTYACTLSTLFYDYDRDGWMDILVGNDFGPFIIGDLLYRNNRDGTFTEVSVSAGFDIEEFNMGLVTADVNGDMIPDVYTTNMGENHLLLNNGRGRFTDVNKQYGVSEAMSAGMLLTSWACMFLDADLDGYRDLYVSNGYIKAAMPNDPDAPSRLLRSEGRTYTICPPALFPWDKLVGRGAACGDLDGDGDEDLVQLNNNDWLRIYRNSTTTANQSLTVDLIGSLSNRDGIGAYVMLRTSEFTQAMDYTRGGSYCSQNASPIIFGIGEQDRAEELIVQWPSGVTSRLVDLAAGSRPQVYEPTVTITSVGTPRPAAGGNYIEIPVTVKNHAATTEAIGFTAELSWDETRANMPTFHLAGTVAAGAEVTESVYLPIPYAAVSIARNLGMWLQVGVQSRVARMRGTVVNAEDQVEFPF